MLYNYLGETFKLKENPEGTFKLYCNAKSKWSTGWTYIGTFNNKDKAIQVAKRYAS